MVKGKWHLSVAKQIFDILFITAKRITHSDHKLTEYFAVRKSVRKTKMQVLREQQRTLERLIMKETEEGLEVSVQPLVAF